MSNNEVENILVIREKKRKKKKNKKKRENKRSQEDRKRRESPVGLASSVGFLETHTCCRNCKFNFFRESQGSS